jgi:lipopolysaccharide transport system permease protein
MRQVTVFEPPSFATVRPLAALKRLQQFSHLIRALTVHRLKVRYARTSLGWTWAVLQPVAFMVVFTLMFTLLGRAPSGDVPYPLFAYAALVPWTAFAAGVANAVTSLTSHSSLLTKVAFPREILPATYVVVALVDVAVASTILLGLCAWYGVTIGAHILWVIPALLLMTVFLAGVALFLSAIQVRYRDVGVAVPILLQVWMFATPIIYPLDAARAALSAELFALYTLNPMVAVVDTFRRATILNAPPDLSAWLTALAGSLLLLPVAYVYFKHSEKTMADVV